MCATIRVLGLAPKDTGAIKSTNRRITYSYRSESSGLTRLARVAESCHHSDEYTGYS
jgi:hypothetical protein